MKSLRLFALGFSMALSLHAQYSYPPAASSSIVASSSTPLAGDVTGTLGATSVNKINGQVPGTAAFQASTAFDPANAALSAQAAAIAASKPASVFLATAYSGGDFSVKINACLKAASAANGGTCDARDLGGSAFQGGSQEIDVLANTTLLLPAVGHWAWGLTNGGCGIKQFENSSVIGTQPGGEGGQMILDSAYSGLVMDALWCTNVQMPANSNYVRAEGFTAENNLGGTFAHGLIHAQDLGDHSTISRIAAVNNIGDALHVDNVCCGITFDNDLFVASAAGGSYQSGGVPCTIGAAGEVITAPTFSNMTCNAPKVGLSNVVLAGQINDAQFFNLYMEGNGTKDNTTPMMTIPSGTVGTYIYGGQSEPGCGACSKYTFYSGSQSAWGVTGFYNNGGLFINDVGSGQNVNGGGMPYYNGYQAPSPAFFRNLQTVQTSRTVYNIPPSSTPSINFTYNGSAQSITLNSNTSPSLSGLLPGVELVLQVCEGSQSYTFTPPAMMRLAPSDLAAINSQAPNTCAMLGFISMNGNTLESTFIKTGLAP